MVTRREVKKIRGLKGVRKNIVMFEILLFFKIQLRVQYKIKSLFFFRDGSRSILTLTWWMSHAVAHIFFSDSLNLSFFFFFFNFPLCCGVESLLFFFWLLPLLHCRLMSCGWRGFLMGELCVFDSWNTHKNEKKEKIKENSIPWEML